MKIEDRLANYMALLQSEGTRTSAKAIKESGAQGTGTATVDAVDVQVSASAAQLAEEEARRIRLDTIRQQLAEGSYTISGKDVADKMLKVLKG